MKPENAPLEPATPNQTETYGGGHHRFESTFRSEKAKPPAPVGQKKKPVAKKNPRKRPG